MNRKKKAFRDRGLLKRAQKELNLRLEESKGAYSGKLENKLHMNNMRDLLFGMKHFTGFKVVGFTVRRPGQSQ